jgi:hypothetical protein
MFLLSKVGGYLAAAGGLLLALLAAWGLARKSGEKAEQQAQKDKAFEQGKESGEIDDKVHNLSDDDLAKQLRKSSRDGV